MAVKVGVMRSLVFDIYRKETRDAPNRWDDLEVSVMNINNSMMLHKSTVAKKESRQALHEMRISKNKLDPVIREAVEEEPFEEI